MKLNNFGNIFKKSEKKYLEENYLASEYTWGFELEGFVHNNLTYDDILFDYPNLIEDIINIDDLKEKNYDGEISDESLECAEEILSAFNNGQSFESVKSCFENERFMNEVFNYHDIDLADRYNYISPDFNQVEDILYDTFKKYISEGNYTKMTSDGSLEPNNKNDYAFEYNTPAMPFKPSVINDMIKMFAELDNTGFYINDTCGFHIHLSYPDIKRDDLIWVLCCLAMDEKSLNIISYLENSGIKLFKAGADQYGTIDSIILLSQYLKEKYWAYIGDILDIEKLTLFRIHPQGTLEWRGPRDFLNKDGETINYNNLYDLFKNLYRLTQFISNSLNKRFIEINGEKLSKDDVLKNILSQPRGISTLKTNSKADTKNFNKYQDFFTEVRRNGFDEEFLKTYLNTKNKCDKFINWLKVYIGNNGNDALMDYLYEYFKRLKEGRLLYPYQYEMLDCIELLS